MRQWFRWCRTCDRCVHFDPMIWSAYWENPEEYGGWGCKLKEERIVELCDQVADRHGEDADDELLAIAAKCPFFKEKGELKWL